MMSMVDFLDDCIVFILVCMILWDVIWMVGVCIVFKRVIESEKLWKDFFFGDYDSICEV